MESTTFNAESLMQDYGKSFEETKAVFAGFRLAGVRGVAAAATIIAVVYRKAITDENKANAYKVAVSILTGDFKAKTPKFTTEMVGDKSTADNYNKMLFAARAYVADCVRTKWADCSTNYNEAIAAAAGNVPVPGNKSAFMLACDTLFDDFKLMQLTSVSAIRAAFDPSTKGESEKRTLIQRMGVAFTNGCKKGELTADNAATLAKALVKGGAPLSVLDALITALEAETAVVRHHAEIEAAANEAKHATAKTAVARMKAARKEIAKAA